MTPSSEMCSTMLSSHLHCILNWPCRSALWMDMSLRLMIIRSVCPALHRNHGLLNGSSAALVHLGQVIPVDNPC